MPRNTPTNEPIDERIEDVDVSAEMQGSFLEYAYSVIYSRALPDARDGLKPVQRRILYQMADMGLRPDNGHVKSARVVGEVMGKLHPHGDSAIYDALVRLAQPFAMRVALVDGHGNFGSLDDGPAASRYTEARLAAPALALTENLDEDVVDFIPNYDGQFMQPAVLPAAYPNLLVNGASGIAVGMATNMAPHNLIEVVAGALHLLENPEATTEELMEFIPGPDFPSGGIVMGLDGVKDAYESGRGAFKVRSKVSIEPLGPRRTGIIVTELPYQVGPERVIDKIKDAVNSKKLQGISDVTDLTDRKNGMRLVIGIKTGFDATAVLEQLYRLTPLEDSFSINNVALVDGQPRTLGLKDLLSVYLKHRLEVVTRRSTYRVARRKERLHLVEGLLLAILDIDEVIQVIRSSDDSETARGRLQQVFELSELQAEYILELRLRRLTKFSRIELESERDKLIAEIAALEELLGSPVLLRQQVARELDAAADTFGTPRRTLLMNAKPAAPRSAKAAAAADLQIADAPTQIVLSATGRAVRLELADGQTIAPPARRSKHDAVLTTLETTTRAEVGAVTNRGRVLRFSPVDLPSVPPASVQLAAGVPLRDYLGITDKKERVLALIRFDDETPLALGTREGVVKRIVPTSIPVRPDVEIIGMKPSDEVVGAAPAPDASDVVFVTSDAQLLHYSSAMVRPQGAPAGGMAGVKLAPGATVIAFNVVPIGSDAIVATVSGADAFIDGIDAGRAKVSDFSEFPSKGRATGGVRAHAFLKGESRLTVAWVGENPRAIGTDGSARVLPEGGSRRDASGTALDAVIGFIGSAIA
ncbi:DNA topoisomerase IV subunit A [Microbacterium mitrae]|uniref:DNA topoisomerase (ATP-hydrolyzing) n=1 Tax=Microbacterium mitrae TaxID=664640 RepID=A0A5C8HR06_9MICO|nr:DNA topoisomerase IV subunit A [Microbacterium mitrae]TXK05463.1 DNA topoisomerase IV subunit A [Microbacterium mitrae]